MSHQSAHGSAPGKCQILVPVPKWQATLVTAISSLALGEFVTIATSPRVAYVDAGILVFLCAQ